MKNDILYMRVWN